MGSNALNALHGKAFSERSDDFSAAQRRESNGIFAGCRKNGTEYNPPETGRESSRGSRPPRMKNQMPRKACCAWLPASEARTFAPLCGAKVMAFFQAVEKVQGLFRQPEKMPLLSRRCAVEKSSLRSLNALPSKAFRAFDPTRGGLPRPRAPPPKLGLIRHLT